MRLGSKFDFGPRNMNFLKSIDIKTHLENITS